MRVASWGSLKVAPSSRNSKCKHITGAINSKIALIPLISLPWSKPENRVPLKNLTWEDDFLLNSWKISKCLLQGISIEDSKETKCLVSGNYAGNGTSCWGKSMSHV